MEIEEAAENKDEEIGIYKVAGWYFQPPFGIAKLLLPCNGSHLGVMALVLQDGHSKKYSGNGIAGHFT